MSTDKTICAIPVDLVDIDPQIRRNNGDAKIAELSASIKTEGQLQPALVCRNGSRFRLIFGERRYHAVRLIGAATLDAVVIDDMPDASSITIKQFVENHHRESLNPIEEALAVQQLMRSCNWTASQTAVKLGIPPATVSRSLSLLKLDDSFQQAIASGRIPASAGYELSKIEDPVKQKALAEQLLSGNLTRDGLSGIAKAGRKRTTAQSNSATHATLRRATAILRPGVAITIAAAELTVDSAIAITQELMARLRKARQSGISLSTLLAMLKDQAAKT